jgi:alkaline phosphatase D
MSEVSRRAFITAALGATLAEGLLPTSIAGVARVERRDLFPEGVASGDPTPDSALLWTRYPAGGAESSARLTVEIATDAAFTHVVIRSLTSVRRESDWTCRVLAGGLKPAHEYWYRFIDPAGNASRIGRTISAPHHGDPRPVRFAFVSCQDCTSGAQNAYRRMIFEDLRETRARQLAFVLHLGDFVYEVVSYPEDRPQGMYDRTLREVVRYPHGEKIDDFHVPADLDDYRALYRAYLRDPDIQDARARWPFIHMWDNHEFSWLGWQSFQKFDGVNRAAQTRKVAANQAWFEYQPARVRKSGGVSLEQFSPPEVVDAPIESFDEHGLGQEANNLAAIGSLTGYRALRWGRNVELLITDQRTYRSEDPLGGREAKALQSGSFPELIPEDAATILDAGRSYNRGKPPAELRYGSVRVANSRRDKPAQTILGAVQKSWFLDCLARSTATWKFWANTIGTLDLRADLQNLGSGVMPPWPSAGYATLALSDFGTAYAERAQIYDWIRDRGVTGFVTVAGDRHSFWAGLAAKALPPEPFEPVGIAFVTGSISAPGIAEALEHTLPKDHPLRALYLVDKPGQAKPDVTLNMLLLHGVRSCLEYQRTLDAELARRASNPLLAPQLSFLDFGGHGYSVVTATSTWIDTEFVCIPRPLTRSETADGGPLRYRVSHRARVWDRGESPHLERRILAGDPGLAI